ncbi:hypothetical protein HETIRDRAFT_107456 [Heterobasidion irregulare TC 32-1]|uniref:Uncharacterized protein n=1 Tax=Heterobasidion irregulare (strain TC 32-1) TaxID=747525 RepID=W4JXK9_HETIT|nr:uncharacterized protein HETIRDRAFT_107456 [Heterobasidion irregulare TC 32-1]ETW77800.1 hypothetical protein HETIRDRAFT_107456 [Heterobasidion irregulare TC 32-1]
MNMIYASDPALKYEPLSAWNSTNPKTNQTGSTVSVQFQGKSPIRSPAKVVKSEVAVAPGTTLKAFGKTELPSIFYSEDDHQIHNQSISAHEEKDSVMILELSYHECSNHAVKLIVFNSAEQGHGLAISKFEYTPCTPNITLAQPSIPYTPIVPPATPAAQSTSPSTSSVSSSSSSSNDTAQTVGIAIGCVLGALLILSVAGLLWQAPHPSGPPKLTALRADLPPHFPSSALSKYAPAADSRALFSVEVIAPSRDEKSELPAPAIRPVEGTSGAAYLRGYLPDSKEWLRNAERARVAAAAAAAAQSAHGEPGGHAAAYEGGIAGGNGERPVV